jgi:hypothetical protein
MRDIPRVMQGRPQAVRVPSMHSMMRPLLAALVMGALLSVLLHQAWGAAACPGAPAVATASAKCAKPAHDTAKATAAPIAVVGAAQAAQSWKTVLEPLSVGGWSYISDGPGENPSAIYASTHNLLHNGNVVTAWMRWEFARPQAEVYPLHYLSAVTREELDCDARSYRRAAVIYYTRNNLQDKGPSFTELDDDTTWKLAIPGSAPDAMLNWACALPTAHATATSGKAVAAGKVAKTPVAAASSAPAAAPVGTDLHTSR